MRPWISLLLLGAGLTAAGATPAAANNMTPRSSEIARNGHIHTPFLRHHFLHRNPEFGPFAFGAPLILPGGYFAGDVASGTPPVIMLSEVPATTASALPPPRPAAEQRPSVETTAEGVVVVRGPGSHHIGY
jgi:hypothetical protein